jgi:hypothetical protein
LQLLPFLSPFKNNAVLRGVVWTVKIYRAFMGQLLDQIGSGPLHRYLTRLSKAFGIRFK